MTKSQLFCKISKRSIQYTILVFLFFSYGCSNHKGPMTDHFDGTQFYMEGASHSMSDMVKWMWQMETVAWPEWINDPEQPPPVDRVEHGELIVTYINHATTLIQIDGMNILTDPIWSLRAGPFPLIGPKRIRNPGVSLEKLPEIDLILISHDHWDHLDIKSIQQIYQRDTPFILTGLGTDAILKANQINKVKGLDWWQRYKSATNDISVTFVPAIHSSGRWPFRHNRTLWGGFVIQSPSGSVYFAGDTGYGDFIQKIAERFDQIRLAILPIGSYEKRWFMKNQHMNPEDATNAHLALNANQSIGMHYATFSEHPEQAVNAHEIDLEIALRKYLIQPSKFKILKFGQGLVVGKQQ
jgi:L-ascorbate metabolism protein UlaG (beta-lactamase superfamily)